MMKKIFPMMLLCTTIVLTSCSKDDSTSIAVSNVHLDQPTLSIKVGESGILTATVDPEEAENKNVTWATSDATIATVDKGVVTAIKTGTATITVTSVSDPTKKANCVVTVSEDATEITLDRSSLLIVATETFTLTATITTEEGENKNVTWSSNNSEVATVSTTGVVMAISKGKAIITASIDQGTKIATCNVSVEEPIINFYGKNYSTEPTFFNKLSSNNGYVNFTPEIEYRLGTDGNTSGLGMLTYNQLLTETIIKVKLTLSGGNTDLQVGYLTDPVNASTFTLLKTVEYKESMPYYTLENVNLPTNGYLTFRYEPKKAWYNIGISRIQTFVQE